MTSSEHHQMITEDGRKRLLEIRQKLYPACRELPQLARQESAGATEGLTRLAEGGSHTSYNTSPWATRRRFETGPSGVSSAGPSGAGAAELNPSGVAPAGPSAVAAAGPPGAAPSASEGVAVGYQQQGRPHLPHR